MAYDGSVKFDTKLDTSGLKNGLNSAGSIAKIAAGNIAADIAKQMANAALSVGKAAIQVGSDFEAAMSSVYAISRASAEEAEKLKEAALEAGRVTQFTASQSANALEYLSLAGYSATESIEALPKVLNLAAAGGMELAYASDLLTDSMAVMGLGIDSMDNFSDQLAMAASKANTSVAQLGEAVLVAGGQAKLCGMDVAEMNTALGILADKGIKGSEGGTALRNALKNLYTPTSTAEKQLKALGIATADADGNLRPMQDVLIDLNNALSTMTEDEKTKAMDQIFDTRTIAAATALLDDCGVRWDELEGYLRSCDGAAEQMAKTMNDNLQGKLKLVASAAESCGIAFYDSISEPLKEAADVAAEQLSFLASEMREGELKEGIEALGEGLGALTKGAIDLATNVLPSLLSSLGWICENIGVIAPLVLGIVGAVKAYTIALAAAQAVTALMNATLVLNPYALAVAGVVALVGAVVALKNATKETETVAQRLKRENEELNESFERGKKEIALEAARCEKLTDALDELIKVENKTDEQKRDMAKIVEELNELFPELNLQFDKETGLLRDANGELVTNTELIRENAKARREEQVKNYYLEQILEKQKALEEAKKKYEETLGEIEENEKRIARYNEEWAMYGILAPLNRPGLLLESVQLTSDELFGTEFGLNSEAENLQKDLVTFVDTINTVQSEIDQLQRTVNSLEFDVDTGEVVVNLESVIDTTDELYQALGEAKTLEEKKQILLDYLTLRPEDTQAAVEMARSLGLEINEEMVRGLSSGSQLTYGELARHLGESLTSEDIKNVLEGKGYVSAGYYVEGVVKGVDNGLEAISEAGGKAAETLDTGFRKEVGIESPAKDGIEAGEFYDEGVVVGVDNGLEAISEAGGRIGTSLVDGLREKKSAFLKELEENLPVGEAVKENAKKATEKYNGLLDVLDRRLDAGLITEREYYEDAEKLRDTYLTRGTKEWLDATQDLWEGVSKLEEEAIEEEFELLEYRYNTGEITEREYYEDLARLRDTYFSENSKEWKEYNKEFIKYQKEACEDLADAVSDAYDEAFDEVKDHVEDLTGGLKSVGDYFSSGTLEINGEEVTYASLTDLSKKTEWLDEYYRRMTTLRDRLKNVGIDAEGAKAFFGFVRDMGEEDAYEYSALLSNMTDSSFADYVNTWLTNEKKSASYAEDLFSDEKTEATDSFINDLESILKEAGKELPDDFFEMGELSGISFKEAFVEGVQDAVRLADNYVQEFVAGILGGNTTNYSAVYNFYSSGQTVAQLLRDATDAAAMERARGMG